MKFLFRLLVVMLYLSISACGGGGGGSSTGGNSSTTYSVTGNITGMVDGGSLDIKFTSDSNISFHSISANGPYSFNVVLPNGIISYNIIISSNPTDQTCSLVANSGALTDLANASLDINCVNNYSVSGTVSGLASPLTLALSGAAQGNATITADGSFIFNEQVPDGSDYLVSVSSSSTDYCAITNGSGTINGADVSNVEVACEPGYKVGGSILNLKGSIAINVNGNINLFTDVSTFESSLLVVDADPYSVTIATQPTTQTCSVTTGGTGTIAAANVSNVAIECVDNPYYLSGNITGIPVDFSATISNGTETFSVGQDESFSFPTALHSGDSYDVSVTIPARTYMQCGMVDGLFKCTQITEPAPQNMVCSVSNGSGTIDAANVSDVDISCTLTYSIGGTVSGLAGTLVLQNYYADDLTINASGEFTFPTVVEDLSSYSVSVLSQPTDQMCTVQSGAGSIAGSNAASITVNCVDVITPLVINDSNGKFPELILSATIGGSVLPTTKEVTITITGLENVNLDSLSYICLEGLPYRSIAEGPSQYGLYTDAQTFCLKVPVTGDVVRTFHVPYGTFAVSLVENYMAMNSYNTRTLENKYMTLKVRGPVFQSTYSGKLSSVATNGFDFLDGFSSGVSLYAEGFGLGTFLDRNTNLTSEFNYPIGGIYPDWDTAYRSPVSYGKYIYTAHDGNRNFPPGERGNNVWLQRFDMTTSIYTSLSFPVHSYCVNSSTETVHLGKKIFDNELRGLYGCHFSVNNVDTNGLVAYRYNLQTGAIISQELIDSNNLYWNYKASLPITGLSFYPPYMVLTSDGDYINKFFFNLKMMQLDSCFDESKGSYYTVVDPQTTAERCVIADSVTQAGVCVEATPGSGACDVNIMGADYVVKAGLVDDSFVMSDGGHIKAGSIGSLCRSDTNDYLLRKCSAGGLDKISVDEQAYFSGYPLSPTLGNSASKVMPSGDIAVSYLDENRNSFLSIGKVNEDALIPGIIPTGEVDENNKRYFKSSDSAYKVVSTCTAAWALTIRDCVDVTDSQRFTIHQIEDNGGQISRGSIIEIEGPDYDQGVRSVAVANINYGDKMVSIAGTWIDRVGSEVVGRLIFNTGSNDLNGSGTGRYWSYGYGYQVDAVYVDYDWRFTGTKIEFRYKNILNCDFLNTHKWVKGTYDPNAWIATTASVNLSTLTLDGNAFAKEIPAGGNGSPSLGGTCIGVN